MRPLLDIPKKRLIATLRRARVGYAEDPSKDFLPSIGKLVHLRGPALSKYVRIDTGVEEGDAITPYYDPMIAKLIVWDEIREPAVRRGCIRPSKRAARWPRVPSMK